MLGGEKQGAGDLRVPDTHRSLLKSNVDVVLTTVGAAGYPHSSMVWCSYDDARVLLNTGRGYTKERNMRRAPQSRCSPTTQRSQAGGWRCRGKQS